MHDCMSIPGVIIPSDEKLKGLKSLNDNCMPPLDQLESFHRNEQFSCLLEGKIFLPPYRCSSRHFVEIRSTITNLECQAFEALAKRTKIDVIYTSKVYGRVNCILLLRNLLELGFPPPAVNCLSSYLDDSCLKMVFKWFRFDEIFFTLGASLRSCYLLC